MAPRASHGVHPNQSTNAVRADGHDHHAPLRRASARSRPASGIPIQVPDAVAEVVDEGGTQTEQDNRPSGDDRIFIAFAYAAGPGSERHQHHTKSDTIPLSPRDSGNAMQADNTIVYPSL
jgi:hypothetical protein